MMEDQRRESRLEQLLRDAAEAESGAPEGIAFRAMTRQNPARRPGAVPALRLFAAGMFSAALCFWLRPIPSPPVSSPRIQTARVEEIPTPRRLKVAPIERPPKARPKYRTEDSFFRRRRPIGQTRKRTRAAEPRARPAPAKAVWSEEIVHQFESGVIAAVLVPVADSEGTVAMEQALVEIPLEQAEVVVPRDTPDPESDTTPTESE